MDQETEELFSLSAIDPSGKLLDGVKLVRRYSEAATRQHELMMKSWAAKQYQRALVELHFFLIAIDRVKDGLNLAVLARGEPLAVHYGSLDLSAYKQARDHFEHIDDRLHITGKNAPKPTKRDGVTRTIHYGLNGGTKTFRWSDREIDISEAFLERFLKWAKEGCLLAAQVTAADRRSP